MPGAQEADHEDYLVCSMLWPVDAAAHVAGLLCMVDALARKQPQSQLSGAVGRLRPGLSDSAARLQVAYLHVLCGAVLRLGRGRGIVRIGRVALHAWRVLLRSSCRLRGNGWFRGVGSSHHEGGSERSQRRNACCGGHRRPVGVAGGGCVPWSS